MRNRFKIKIKIDFVILATIIFLFNIKIDLTKDFGGDFLGYFVPHYHFITQSLRDGIIPFWFPYNFAGLPEIFKSELSIFHPFTIFYLVTNYLLNRNLDPSFTGNLRELFMTLAQIYGSIGMYILGMKYFFKNRWILIYISLLFVLGPSTSYLTNTTVYLGIITLPWLINSLIDFMYIGNKKKFMLVVVYNLLIFSVGYPYYFLYFFLLQSLLVLVINYKKLPMFIIAYLFALGISSFFMLPYLYVIGQSSRADAITNHSIYALKPTKIIQLINPLPYGESYSTKDPQDLVSYPQFTFGSISLIFLVVGLVNIKKSRKYYWLILSMVIFLFYSFGGYLLSNEFFGIFMPMLNKFRSHAQGFIIVYFCGCILTGRGIETFSRKKTQITTYVTIIALAILVILFSSAYLPVAKLTFEELNGWIRSLLLFFFSIILATMFINRIKIAYPLLALLLLIESFFVYNKMSTLADHSYADFYQKNSLIKSEMLNNPSIRTNFENNQFAYNNSHLKIFQLAGYEAVPNKAWYDFFEKYPGIKGSANLNTKYIVTTNHDMASSDKLKLIKTIDPATKSSQSLISSKENLPYLTSKSTNTHYIYELKEYVDRYFFPTSIYPCNNRECLSNESFPNNIAYNGEESFNNLIFESSKIDIQKYSPNEVILKVNSNDKAFVASSEIYDEGWNVEINGKKDKVYKISTGFRGFFINNEGQAIVRLYYYPPYLNIGIAITIFSVLLLLIFLASNLFHICSFKLERIIEYIFSKISNRYIIIE